MLSKLHIDGLPNFLKSFGVVRGLRLYSKIHIAPWRGQLFAVNVGGRTIWLRRTASDTAIFFQIFVQREYDTSEFSQHAALQQRYKAILASGRTPIVIDAGANVGLAALWFTARYPDARIISVEPDDANLALLEKNTEACPAIVRVHGAVWDQPGQLKIGNPGAGAGALRVVEAKGPVRAYSIPELLAMEKNGVLFIVKVDIEGGESALFRSHTEWAQEPAAIIAELHDWLYPGEGTSSSFLGAMAALRMDFLVRGENVFCFKAK